MKKNLAIAYALVLALFVGYNAGIRRATTAEGWIDGDKFILEVDNSCYEWWIDEK